MTFGFQQVIALPLNNRLVGAQNQTWTLPLPVGAVRVCGLCSQDAINSDDLAARALELNQNDELTFFGSGFAAEGDAKHAGERLGGWLRITSALESLGFDLGDQTARSGFTPEGLKAFFSLGENEFFTSDVHGLITYDEHGSAKRPRMRMHTAIPLVVVSLPSEKVLAKLRFVAERVGDIPDKVTLSCNLLSSVPHLAQSDAKFLTLMYALEALAPPTSRKDEGRRWVESAIADLKTQTDWLDTSDQDSLLGAMSTLLKKSIKVSLIDHARSSHARPEESEALIRKAYKLRNERVHPRGPLSPLDEIVQSLTLFIQESLANVLDLEFPLRES